MRYPLAKQGIFRTIQGEGDLLGVPMIFIRLAGCSIGCPLCDTDYKVHERAETQDIISRCQSLRLPAYPKARQWVWITGGEPMDHNLVPLVHALLDAEFAIAMATSGHQPWPREVGDAVGHFSISPHDPSKWTVRAARGELKIVPGLNGFHLKHFFPDDAPREWFGSKWVIPCEGKPETVRECQDWVEAHPDWKMGVQAHKQWGLA